MFLLPDLYFFLNRASAVLFNTVVKLSFFFKWSIRLRQLLLQLLANTAAAQPKESVESEDNLVKLEKNIRWQLSSALFIHPYQYLSENVMSQAAVMNGMIHYSAEAS